MIRKGIISIWVLLFCLTFLHGQVDLELQIPADTFSMGQDIPLDIKVKDTQGHSVQSMQLMVLDSVGLVKYLFPEDSSFKDEVVIPVDFEITDYGQWADSGTSELKNDLGTNRSKNSEGTSKIQLKIWDPGYFMLMIGEMKLTAPDGEEALYYPPTQHGQLVFIQPPELAEQGEIEMLPIKDIMREGWHWTDFKWLYIVVAALALFLFLINRPTRQRKKKEKVIKEKISIRPAHEIAFEKLEELRMAELWKKDRVKEHQTQLSFIVREYLENRYQIKALESTTAEITRDLNTAELEAKDVSELRDLLQIADLVKFAKAKPKEDIHARFLQQVFDFVERTQKMETDKEEK
jgi:hypothetical protein